MKTREHFFFKIDKNSLRDSISIEPIVKNLKLPENEFPPKFFIKEEGFFCTGYFVCYNQSITTNTLLGLCKKHAWKYLTSLIGDFLILCCDLNARQLFILTDQTGKFPCYFAFTKEGLIVSTDFYAIVKSLPSLNLDIIGSLDYLHRNNNVTDRTILQEIQQIPPATLLAINHEALYSLESMIDIDSFLNEPFEKYSSIEEFSNNFFLTLNKIVNERLRTINKHQFSSEISSGFDSSLVSFLLKKNSIRPFTCYSRVAQGAVRDSDPKIVSEFAKKHNLNIKFILCDHIFPFSTEEDLFWIKRGPSQLTKAEVYHHLQIMHNDKNVLYFTGDGGDEIYHMDEKTQNMYLRFPVQMQYFERLSMRNLGIDKLLTKKALEILFDRKHFQEKHAYPLCISTSAATIHTDTFPLSWATKMWPITPLADPRLVQIARGIPKVNGKTASKLQIWAHRTDIFPPGQFIPKARGGPDNQIKRYLTEKAEFVVSVLKNSLLGDKGWAKASKIAKNVQSGKVYEYYESNVMSYIANLLELEYFIQKNNIKVPN